MVRFDISMKDAVPVHVFSRLQDLIHELLDSGLRQVVLSP